MPSAPFWVLLLVLYGVCAYVAGVEAVAVVVGVAIAVAVGSRLVSEPPKSRQERVRPVRRALW